MTTANFLRGAPAFDSTELLLNLRLTNGGILSPTRAFEEGTSGGRTVRIDYEGTGFAAGSPVRGTIETVTFSASPASGGSGTVAFLRLNDVDLPLSQANRLFLEGDFTVIGSSEGDILGTGDGDDIYRMGAGDDIVDAQGGNDVIDGGSGDDELRGGAGNDLFIGGPGNDLINGGPSRDTVSFARADAGISRFIPASFSSGSAGYEDVEVFVGSAFDDSVTFDFGVGLETVVMGDGDDRVTDAPGRVFLGDGDDEFATFFGDSARLVNGGAGFDTVSYAGDFNASTLVPPPGEEGPRGGYAIDLANSANAKAGAGDRSAVTTTFVSIERFIGAISDDLIRGTRRAEVLAGNDGNDILIGRFGDDTLRGDDGDDVLNGGAGADLLVGGAGTDVASYAGARAGITLDRRGVLDATGDAAGDRLFGVETVRATSFDDVIVGAAGADTFIGDAGSDKLFGNFGDDRLFGGAGNDLLVGGAGADLMVGGSGIDTVSYRLEIGGVEIDLRAGVGGGAATGDVLRGVEIVAGTASNDTIAGAAAAERFLGGAGDDVLDGRYGNDLLRGEDGADRLIGGAGNDVLIGGAGGDTFVFDAGSGFDRITDFQVFIDTIEIDVSGLTFDDLTIVDRGAFTVVAFSDGADGFNSVRLNGIAAADLTADDFVLGRSDAGPGTGGTGEIVSGAPSNSGGPGDDVFVGTAAAQAFVGGAGTDTVTYAAAPGPVDFYVGFPNQSSGGFATGDTFDSIEIITGSRFDDDMFGGDGNETIDGGAGDDIVRGGAGNDRLFGGAGRDTIHDGAGDGDVVTGGAGPDRFVFDFTYGNTTITDFTRGEDILQFSSTGQSFESLRIADGPDGATITYLGTNPLPEGDIPFDFSSTRDNVVTLNGVAAADLTADDFLF